MADRKDLKTYFETGKIPTQEHFEKLIDSSYNLEDGVNGPLKIGGAGQGNGDKLLINFYTNAVDPDDPQWAIKLADYGQEGFTINENNDQPRLFIKKGSGEIGVGTTNPRMSLQVDTPSLYGVPAIGGYFAGSNNHPGWLYMHVVGNANAEHAIIWDDKRPLRFGVETNMGDGRTFKNLLKIQPETGKGVGIFFPDDIGGGGSDRAWIRYYARSGEATTLEIGTSDNTDDHIALMPSGNVGIGTNTPNAKLQVVGGPIVPSIGIGQAGIIFKDQYFEGARIQYDVHNQSLLFDAIDSSIKFNVSGQGQVEIIGGPIVPTIGDGSAGIIFVEDGRDAAWIKYSNQSLIFQAFSDIIFSLGGQATINGHLVLTGGRVDFAELFEVENGEVIPVGTTVVFTENGFIRSAIENEIPIGIVSVLPGIICNEAIEWPKKYLKNEFGQTLTEEVEEDIIIPDGKTERAKVAKPILNPDYDPNREYIPRSQRPEWHPVGLLGQLHLRKGQPVAPTWVKIKDVSENVELWLVK